MPIYAFRCRECSKHFERILSLRDAENEEQECPSCNKTETVERIITTHGTYNISGDNSASTRPRRA